LLAVFRQVFVVYFVDMSTHSRNASSPGSTAVSTDGKNETKDGEHIWYFAIGTFAVIDSFPCMEGWQ
jgi:hypothetical protein